MKVIAKYITSMQIFHLLGGAILNVVTLFAPIDPRGASETFAMNLSHCQLRSAINTFLCFSYFFLFLAFFSKKYGKNGSIWSLLKTPKRMQETIITLQKKYLRPGVESYLIAQGLLV